MILDVGCGKHKHGDIGIDYSRDSNADIIADAHFLPFKLGCFSKVVSNCVLEHSPNPLIFLKEQYRILRDGGNIECLTDNAQYYGWSVLKIRGQRHEKLHGDHYAIFFPENVIRLMKIAGFKDCSLAYVRKKRRLDLLCAFFVKIGFWRKESFYKRFKVICKK